MSAIWQIARRRKGLALVELLVAVVLILIAVGVYFGMFHGKGKGKKTTPGQAMDKAKATACAENLRQIRMAVKMETMAGDPAPPNLAALRFPAESTHCPVSGQPYVYNPRATGDDVVRCPTHPNL